MKEHPLKRLLKDIGILCWLRSKHQMVGHIDSRHRVCVYCGRCEERAGNKWIKI